MANDIFSEWHEWHVTIFALADEDAVSVAAWRKALASYSVDELHGASQELLIAAPKSFRNDHVPGFFRILARNRERARPKGQVASACRCPSCQAAKGAPSTTAATDLPAKFSFVRAAAKRARKLSAT